MTDEQIKHMIDRFLGWRLPENFNPDGGVSFQKIGNEGTPHAYAREPSGTNLFDATQAQAMIRYLVDGMPLTAPAPDEAASELTAMTKERDAFRNMTKWSVRNDGECLGDHPELLEAARAALEGAKL